jgi:DNA-binding transcriptional MerR regulator
MNMKLAANVTLGLMIVIDRRMAMNTFSIGEFAKKTGLTVRTLHYYDEIGILKPSYLSDKGKRIYTEENFITLHKIITLKFLGYSLEEIKVFLKSEKWDLKDSLSIQKEAMVKQKEQLEQVIRALDHAIYIVDHHGELDSSIFITLINDIQMEKEHKKFLKGVLDDQKVEQIFSIDEKRHLEINTNIVGLLTDLKEHYGADPKSAKVQLLIDKLIDIFAELTGGDLHFLEEVTNVEINDEDWAIPFPFPKEVEEWISKGIDINLQKRGITINERKKGTNKN